MSPMQLGSSILTIPAQSQIRLQSSAIPSEHSVEGYKELEGNIIQSNPCTILQSYGNPQILYSTRLWPLKGGTPYAKGCEEPETEQFNPDCNPNNPSTILCNPGRRISGRI